MYRKAPIRTRIGPPTARYIKRTKSEISAPCDTFSSITPKESLLVGPRCPGYTRRKRAVIRATLYLGALGNIFRARSTSPARYRVVDHPSPSILSPGVYIAAEASQLLLDLPDCSPHVYFARPLFSDEISLAHGRLRCRSARLSRHPPLILRFYFEWISGYRTYV